MNIDYTKLGQIGAEAAQKAMKTWYTLIVHKNHPSWEIDEPARTAYAEAVVKGYLEQVGEGLPTATDCLQSFPPSPTVGQGIEAIRSLMMSAFAKKLEAVAKLPEKWLKYGGLISYDSGFQIGRQCHLKLCAEELEQALSLPAVEVEIDPYAELKSARAEGKIIQWMTSTGWANHIYPDEECALWMHPAKDYRIAPEQPAKTGKLTDEELGRIGLQTANYSNHQTDFYQAFARAVREAVEKQQGEEIARLTARSVGQLLEITSLHHLLDAAEAELSIVTAERDRLRWRPVSVKPTREDADSEGYIAVTDGKDCDAWLFGNWADILPHYTHWIPFCPPPAPSAQEVERERFEIWAATSSFGHDLTRTPGRKHYNSMLTSEAWELWQAARALKEGEG